MKRNIRNGEIKTQTGLCHFHQAKKEIKKWWGSSAYIYIYIYIYVYICVLPFSSGKKINERKQIQKKLKVCNFKKNIKYLEMEKYNQIREEIRNLQHQGKYFEKNIWKREKIEYQRLKRVSDQKNIWRKTSSTVSWKSFQYRKKLIHKKKYRIPCTVNIAKETF